MPGQYLSGTQKSYEYFAFISYSRKDEKWAKRLQQALEKYRLPMALYKEEESLPKNIRPVFRDVTDLSAGKLQNELHRQLDDSKKLIVICSRWSAKSEWVNKEICHFVENRGYENVIPLIVDGAPNGGDAECFPEALRLPDEDELLGVSVKELGWRDAFLRVVSGLLDVKFDSLKRRHEQMRKKQNMITTAAILLFLALSGFAGYRAWDYYVPHEAYYADYVLRMGVPEGIGPLSEQALSGRMEHYILVTEKRRVVRLVHANSAGMPIPHSGVELLNRPMIARYSYGDDGQVHTVEYVDKNGKVLLAQYYTPDHTAMDFIASGDNSVFQTLNASTASMSAGMLGLNATDSTEAITKSDIARHAFEYDENGYVTKVIYMRDNRRTPILDAEGIGGQEYKLDDYGRPVEVRYLGLGGDEYTTTKQNVAGRRFTYDDAHNLVREEHVDPNGEPVLNEQGWMIAEIEFDANGNDVKQSSVDANGNLLPSYYGFALTKREFDNRGNLIKESYFDADGEPYLNSYGFAAVKMEYDDRGNETQWAAYGMDDEPVLTVFGYFSIQREYDEWGNSISVAFFGPDGGPVLFGDGYSRAKLEYDERGNLIRGTYLGLDGQPTLIGEGYAIFEQEYDERDNRIGTSFFGIDDKPILIVYGYASEHVEYDERGNLIKESYFGPDGQPILTRNGYAAGTLEYDERGNVIKTSYFGADGRPILSGGGCAGFAQEYDERGNMTMESYFGTDGLPILNSYGYSTRELEFNERGKLIKITYLGTNGLPVLLNDGYSSVVLGYDEYDNLIEKSFFDLNGLPVVLS